MGISSRDFKGQTGFIFGPAWYGRVGDMACRASATGEGSEHKEGLPRARMGCLSGGMGDRRNRAWRPAARREQNVNSFFVVASEQTMNSPCKNRAKFGAEKSWNKS